MRFLLDQDVYAITAKFLTEIGHDVRLVADFGLSQAPDEEILSTAQEQKRKIIAENNL
jgi:predicted nuclease of predicted toxin-antitoxin system